MKNRRNFVMGLISCAVALVVIVAPAIADELFGTITMVDAEAKKVTVVEKDTDKEVLVTVTDETEWVTPKGSSKLDFTKVAKNLEKAKSQGKKGINVIVTHEKAVASKIAIPAKKKEAAPQN